MTEVNYNEGKLRSNFPLLLVPRSGKRSFPKSEAISRCFSFCGAEREASRKAKQFPAASHSAKRKEKLPEKRSNFPLLLVPRSGMRSFPNEVKNMNFHSKKTQKIISSIIIVILVLAMVVPTLISFL